MSVEDEGMRDVANKYLKENRLIWYGGELVTFHALGEDTGGLFTLFEETIAPQSAVSMPHLHHEEDQGIYVLDGEHEFTCDGHTFGAKAGAFVYIPRGTVHSFENVGTTPGRLLIFSTPAGGTEGFFFELGEPATDTSSPPPDVKPPEMQEQREVLRRHGSDIDTFALLQQLSASPPPQQVAKDERTTEVNETDR